jgi:hypothetical protein
MSILLAEAQINNRFSHSHEKDGNDKVVSVAFQS